jgi:predicted LPLAT superfamily acyltransferase
MEAPVYFMFGLRVRDDKPLSAYDMHVYRSQTDFSGSRKERKQKIRSTIEEYIGHLERLSGEHPFQWYNFYDFWQTKQDR